MVIVQVMRSHSLPNLVRQVHRGSLNTLRREKTPESNH